MNNFSTRRIIIFVAFIIIAVALLITSNRFFKGSVEINDPKHQTNTTGTKSTRGTMNIPEGGYYLI